MRQFLEVGQYEARRIDMRVVAGQIKSVDVLRTQAAADAALQGPPEWTERFVLARHYLYGQWDKQVLAQFLCWHVVAERHAKDAPGT